MNRTKALSFLETTFRAIYPQDFDCRQQAEARLAQLAMSQWAFGDLRDLAVDLAGMTRTLAPPLARKQMVVMVGDHGVAAEGVSQYSLETTSQMVQTLVGGGAASSLLAGRVGAEMLVVDVGAREDCSELVRQGKLISKKIGHGTANMVHGPGMTRTHAVMAVEAGIEVANSLAEKVDIFATGGMGVGNTIPSTAIAAVFTGKQVTELIGRGEGIDDARLQHKIAMVEHALACNTPNAKDGLDVLTKVGGLEIGAVAGLILGAAAKRKPVVVDGLVATAGAMIAWSLEPFVRDYLICSHGSSEPGHTALLEKLRLRPLLDLKLHLGEGSGALLALPLVEAAAAALSQIPPLTATGVSSAQ